MSLHPQTQPLSIDRLGPPDLIETFAFLDEDPVVHVYLVALSVRDALAQPRDEFWGVRRDGNLVGLLHLGGQSGAVLPVSDDPDAIALIAEHLIVRRGFLPQRFQVIGRREAVRAIVARLEEDGVRPRLDRDQCYMSLDREHLAPHPRVPDLIAARPEHQSIVFESGADLRAEELEEDPREVDVLAYARRVEEECRDGYTLVWLDDRGLRFRASVSARTPDAAQISGVFVPRDRRGRGYAQRGMAELCSRLLEDSRNVCLFVNDFNAPALAVYRKIGFTSRADWASAFYDLRS